jgi:hypothetical protein
VSVWFDGSSVTAIELHPKSRHSETISVESLFSVPAVFVGSIVHGHERINRFGIKAAACLPQFGAEEENGLK